MKAKDKRTAGMNTSHPSFHTRSHSARARYYAFCWGGRQLRRRPAKHLDAESQISNPICSGEDTDLKRNTSAPQQEARWIQGGEGRLLAGRHARIWAAAHTCYSDIDRGSRVIRGYRERTSHARLSGGRGSVPKKGRVPTNAFMLGRSGRRSESQHSQLPASHVAAVLDGTAFGIARSRSMLLCMTRSAG